MQSRCESTPSPFFISSLNLSYSPQCRAWVISDPASLSLSISYSNHRATPNAIRGFVCPPTSRFPCVTSIVLYEVSRIYKYLNTVSPCPMPCVFFQHTRSHRARSCVQSGKLNHWATSGEHPRGKVTWPWTWLGIWTRPMKSRKEPTNPGSLDSMSKLANRHWRINRAKHQEDTYSWALGLWLSVSCVCRQRIADFVRHGWKQAETKEINKRER